ncbi:MAG: hypothetical protein IT210_17300 [Armatimonadetes bacterium]|nr:hypothetical protein [Armatimonadota bacterium]
MECRRAAANAARAITMIALSSDGKRGEESLILDFRRKNQQKDTRWEEIF